MRTSKNTKALIVGIFTVVGVGILVVGIFALGGQHKLFSANATIRTSFANVNGLQAGNNVWFEGVNVGAVKSLFLLGDCRVEVVMNIEKRSCRYIPSDAKARIGADGLIGNRIVVIEGGSHGARTLKSGDTIQSSQALTGEQLVNTLQRNNLNLVDITDNLKKVTSDLANGRGTAGSLLTDKSLSDKLQSIATMLRAASANAQQLTGNLADYSAKLQTNGSFSNSVVTDTIVFSKLRAILDQIEKASSTINEVAGNLKSTSENLNDKTKPVGAFTNDQQVTDTMKVLLSNLNSASKKLDQDLEAMQHSWPLRGYFKKKAKQEPAPTKSQ